MYARCSIGNMRSNRVCVRPIDLPAGLEAFRMKGISDGTLWLNHYDIVWIFSVDPNTYHSTSKGYFRDRHIENNRNMISIADARVSPVIATHADASTGSNTKLLQVNYQGDRDCVIAEGSYNQITASIHDPDTIYCLLDESYVSVYRYDAQNTGNKWIHARVYLLRDAPPDAGQIPRYSRIQIRSQTMLVATTFVIDEIDLNTGKFQRRIDNRPALTGLYMCCVDWEDNVLVVDIHNNALYILDRDSRWNKITTDRPLTRPHDATLYNGKLFLLTLEKAQIEGTNRQTNLFMLEVQAQADIR